MFNLSEGTLVFHTPQCQCHKCQGGGSSPDPGPDGYGLNMMAEADMLADESVTLLLTPSYLVIEWRHLRKLHSLLTGVSHFEEMQDKS